MKIATMLNTYVAFPNNCAWYGFGSKRQALKKIASDLVKEASISFK
jgi:hypothetical protein